MKLKSGSLLLLLFLLLIIMSTAQAAATDTTPPVWPQGSKVTALRITTDSIFITWTAASDDSGVVNYRVYLNGAWDGMLHMSNSFGIQGLSPNTTITFRLTAGDLSNNWSDGPSATFTSAPAECAGFVACLVYKFTYDKTSYPGGTVNVLGLVTNEGQVALLVTGMTVSGDLGIRSLTGGTTILLGVGESGARGLAISVPLDETIGTHSLVFSISWQYNSTGMWTQGNDLVQNSTFSVNSPPGRNEPFDPAWGFALVASALKALAGYAYLLAGLYLVLVSLASAAVVRSDRKKRATLLKPRAPA